MRDRHVKPVELPVGFRAFHRDVAHGKLRARQHKHARFTATRTSAGGATATTSSTTTTTLPGAPGCGNGIRDGTETCDGLDGCGADERCTPACTCQVVPRTPTVS